MFTLDYTQMITNLAKELAVGGPVWVLVNAFCYFMSFVFLLVSTRQLKDVAEAKMQGGYFAPFMTFLAATLLATLPSTIATVATAVYGEGVNTSILMYDSGQVSASPIKAVLTIVQTVGYIFFIRGILELRRAGEPNRFQGASVNKAIVILVSGMASIYIDKTLGVIATITGWNLSAIL